MTLTAGDRYIRLFEPTEFQAPEDWPEGIGLAVVAENAKIEEIHPFHEVEEASDLIDRLAESQGIELSGIEIVSSRTEAPDRLTSFSTDRAVLDELEERISKDHTIFEAAEDFLINFRFALEEGVPYLSIPQKPDLDMPAPAEEKAEAGARPERRGRAQGGGF